MMAEQSSAERTEKATVKRREKARDRGQVARSNEVTSAVLLAAGTIVLVAGTGHFTRVLGRNTSFLLSQAHKLNPANQNAVNELVSGNLEVLLAALAPLLLVVLLAAVGANVMQIGFHVSSKAIAFRTEKLNPLTGMKRFFQKTTYFEMGKHFLKILIIGLLAWATIRGMMGPLAASAVLPLPEIVALARTDFTELMIKLLLFMVVLGVIDWFWQKNRHEENLKMTRQEVKTENKDIEGDPQIKARVRGLQLEMARKRMMADVPTADVVVTNPTHYAVALKYASESAAPMVVAKGQDHVAMMIRQVARKARVPIIENKLLARSLHKQVDVGAGIPEALYQAVAEVLAYVYRLQKA
jgi:flagellar biosynthetic protein FlhB